MLNRIHYCIFCSLIILEGESFNSRFFVWQFIDLNDIKSSLFIKVIIYVLVKLKKGFGQVDIFNKTVYTAQYWSWTNCVILIKVVIHLEVYLTIHNYSYIFKFIKSQDSSFPDCYFSFNKISECHIPILKIFKKL